MVARRSVWVRVPQAGYFLEIARLTFALLAQWIRATSFYLVGHTFESCTGRLLQGAARSKAQVPELVYGGVVKANTNGVCNTNKHFLAHG